MTASAFSLSILVFSDAFEVQGETVIGGLHGAEQRHNHCGHCLSWLFTRIAGLEEVVNVRATMFDDLDWFTPFLETATDEKLPWVNVPAQHSYEALPPAAEFPSLMAAYADATGAA